VQISTFPIAARTSPHPGKTSILLAFSGLFGPQVET